MFYSGSSVQPKSQDKASDKPAAPSASTSKTEFLEQISYFELRFTRLAQAVPFGRYTGRPAEGVCSVGEVYLPIVQLRRRQDPRTCFLRGLGPHGRSFRRGRQTKSAQGPQRLVRL